MDVIPTRSVGERLRTLRTLMVGPRGEMRVARTLRVLEDRGYRTLHEINTGFGTIDHVVVGPTGVFALEKKAWKGRVSLGKGPQLIQSGRDATPVLKQTLRSAMEVRRRIGPVGPLGWVQAFLVLTHTRLPLGPIRLRNASMIEAGDLLREIESRPTALSPAYVQKVTAALLASSPA